MPPSPSPSLQRKQGLLVLRPRSSARPQIQLRALMEKKERHLPPLASVRVRCFVPESGQSPLQQYDSDLLVSQC